MHHILASMATYLIKHASFVLFALAILIYLCLFFARIKHNSSLQNINTFLSYVMLLPIGIGCLWQFVLHAFFPNFAMHITGWAKSPFEFEFAVANLAVGIAGVCSFQASKGFRAATTLFITVFLWGDAAEQIKELSSHQQFHFITSHLTLYADVLIPIFLIGLLIRYCKHSRSVFSHMS